MNLIYSFQDDTKFLKNIAGFLSKTSRGLELVKKIIIRKFAKNIKPWTTFFCHKNSSVNFNPSLDPRLAAPGLLIELIKIKYSKIRNLKEIEMEKNVL